MKIDITSMFFNSSVNGTATPAWRTALGQSMRDGLKIKTSTPGMSDILSGMTYCAQEDFSKLNLNGASGDVLVVSLFEKVFVNGQHVTDSQFVMLIIRDTSATWSGRLQLCYSPRISFNKIPNSEAVKKMAAALECTDEGCWFVYDISILNQDELHFSAMVVNKTAPEHYDTGGAERTKIWESLIAENIRKQNNDLLKDDIKKEFSYYLQNCVTSNRRTGSRFKFGRSAIDSVLSYTKSEVLFAYNPEKWTHIESIFCITTASEIDALCKELIEDEEFVKYDEKHGQWGLRTITLYNAFIYSRTYFSRKDGFVKKVESKGFYKLISPLQQIFYGAPGTGKSNKVKELTGDVTFGKNFTFRTTFHPDTDYASFMGAYKPKWDEGTGKIVYDFRPQTFLKAYIKAWTNPSENVALVIEEINRGNCAQIFGDIFQLLDRENNGLSKYPIEADIDMQSYLCKELASMSEEDKDAINEYYSQHYEEAFNKIKNGEILTLPKNLSLLATMNTSDQSLFPMDSAFKRRWEWIYKPIVNAEKNWKIEVSDDYELVDWWDFLTLINGEISDLTTSEDKQLGYFFCQPDKDITTISAKNFVGKVIFYLWNDIFKDYGYEPKCCKDDNGKELLYAMFYDGEGEKVNTETLATFFTNLSKSNEKIQLLKKKATPSAETTETLETSESTDPRTEE